MAENAVKNPYIVRALETLKYRNFPALQTKLRLEGKEVIPTVVTLAFVLEKITSAMKHNWRFLRLCNKIWSRYDNLPKILAIYSTQAGREYSSSFRNDYSWSLCYIYWKNYHLLPQGLFKIAKVLSVEEVTKRVLQYFETEHLPKEMASNMEYFFSLHARNRYYLYSFINLFPFILSPIDNFLRI